MSKRNPNRREFLMLAHDYDPKKHSPAGMYASEKLDGIRAFWDGGITRNLLASEVPWANTAKHGRFKEELRATGLWSRYGQPIQAPSWWLDKLPKVPLDGELWTGRGEWQQISSIVKTIFGEDKGWNRVRYMAFDSPSPLLVLKDGEINNTNFKKHLSGCISWFYNCDYPWVDRKRYPNECNMPGEWPFYKTVGFMNSVLSDKKNEVFNIHDQRKLPVTRPQAEMLIDAMLRRIEAEGGEGLILRCPMSIWEPHRTYSLLKVKSCKDAEGVVIGYKWGKPSDVTRTVNGEATDKMLGLMGSLTIDFNGRVFDLSGFTDSERIMSACYQMANENVNQLAFEYGKLHAGEKVNISQFTNILFPVDSKVTFKYRELTDDGYPKEARYFRKHVES